MKYSAVLVAATLAASVSAQIGNIPNCALQCAFSSIGSTSCQQTDIACVCKASGFIAALTPCVEKACTPAEVEQTITAAKGLCASFGVSLSIPPVASSTAAPSTTSSAAATTEVSTTVSTTSTTLSTTVSTTVVIPTTAANTTTTVVAPTPSSNATTAIPTTALPTASPTGNAASRNSVAIGGVAAILAFAAALL